MQVKQLSLLAAVFTSLPLTLGQSGDVNVPTASGSGALPPMASDDGLPRCAMRCMVFGFEDVDGCDGADDLSCYCADSGFLDSWDSCIGSNCTESSDRQEGIEWLEEMCGDHGVSTDLQPSSTSGSDDGDSSNNNDSDSDSSSDDDDSSAPAVPVAVGLSTALMAGVAVLLHA